MVRKEKERYHLLFLLTRGNRCDLLNTKEGSHHEKSIAMLLILFCAIALPALAELTDADLDKIRLIVKEEIEPIKDDIVTSEN